MPLEPLICRSRYGNVKKSYKNKRNLENQKKHIYLCSVEKKQIVLTVSDETLKTK